MDIEILKFDHLGNGIGKINEKVVFVKRALPCEVVSLSINETKKNYQVATIKEIKKRSNDRIESICPYYDLCGGCDFLHTKREVEINFKKDKGKELISNEVTFFDTNEYNYRNKVTFHVKGDKIGFFDAKTNNLVNIDYCYLLDNRINEVLISLKKYLKENSVNLKEAVIKVGNDIMLSLKGEVNDKLLDYLKDVDTVIINDIVLKGKGYIETKLLDYKFKISPNSFFQVNNQGLELIFKILKSNLKEHYHKALDLYSGTSVMGILISSFCDSVICVENCKSSCQDALINIKNNNIKNIQIINDKVENVIEKLTDTDLIIVDPPRSGLDKKTISYINKILPKTLIYISCNMITLKRDLNVLLNDYNLNNFYLVNMFPKTYHVECVILLQRKD